MSASGGRAKKAVFAVVTVVLVLVVCYVVIEYVFAGFYFSNVSLTREKVFDPEIGWRLKPGHYWVKPSHTFRKHEVVINQVGVRGREVSEYPEGAERILILGDSFAFSKTVREEAIFPTLLEETLNKELPGEYVVINSGVIGYGTAQELMRMRRLAEQGVTADIYLLMVFSNDILDNLRLGYGDLAENHVQPGYVLSPEGGLELKYLPEEKLKDDSGTFRRVKQRRRTKMFDVLRIKLEAFFETRPGLVKLANRLGAGVAPSRVPGLINGWYREDILEAGLPLMKALMGEIKKEVEAKGATLLVGVIPSPIQIYPETYGPLLKRAFPDTPEVKAWLDDPLRSQRLVEEMCGEMGIPCHDLYPVLLEHNHESLYLHTDGHFSENGHSIAARSLADFVKAYLGSAVP